MTARFTGLGADDQFEMAPFADDDEREAYWQRVRELRAELKRVREGDDGDDAA